MAEAIVTVKLQLREIDLITESLEAYLETQQDLIDDPVVKDEDKAESRTLAIRLKDLIESLQ